MIPKNTLKRISLFLAFSIVYQIVFPTAAYALTGGPSQAEVQSFEPVGTTQMVDPFTGDFNYNIPLLDVDGYPINIAYHSGVTMDQEASWVGLGWNLNPGAINRNMRGLPDDFSGGADKVEKTLYMKPTKTTAVTLLGSAEYYGMEGRKNGTGLQASYGIGVNYDNYRGLGFENTIGISGSIGMVFEKSGLGAGINGGVNLSSSTKDGLTITPELGMRFMGKLPVLSSVIRGNASMSVAMSINSRSGLKSKTFNKSVGGSIGAFVAYGTSTTISNSITSFGTQTYTPAIPIRMSNSSFAFSGKYSQEWGGWTPGLAIIGFHAQQSIAVQHEQISSYGYMHSEKANRKQNVLMDFNREKDGSFSTASPILAIPINTFDLFSATGHGMAGMFRPFRSDLGMVRDRESVDYSDANTTNLEFGIGPAAFKAGLNRKTVTFKQRVGPWYQNNNLRHAMAYQQQSHESNPLYEPSYFKAVGEMTPIDESLLAYSDLKSPIRPMLTRDGEEVSVNQTSLVKETNGSVGELSSITKKTTRTKREVRNQLMTVKTVGEREFCSQSMISYFNPTANAKTAFGTTMARNVGFRANVRPDNHITEVSVINAQGTKYVYGIPAYNNAEYNFAFTNAYDPDDNVIPNSPTQYVSEGQVGYDYGSPIFGNPSAGNFKNRRFKGNNHMFECTKVPAYAHSFLLTEIHSPDYREFGDQGPNSGSAGSYTKLDYYLIKGGESNNETYKWRVPVKAGRANLNEGYKSVETDDAANILYGEKEVWLVRSIEGRNHIAYFFISKREDGLGVNGVHGGTDINQRSYKLDKIELYSKKDLNTPIKTVHFEYDYSLCPGVENNSNVSVNKLGNTIPDVHNPSLPNVNGGGKLTLTKIYFTYGTSTKGKFNAYTFNYSTSNPSYNLTGYDRWGNYKKASTVLGAASNTEFPYVDQNQSDIDFAANASAWSLTDIVMPSGGKLSVKYEADDYAYVQDRKAMTMYQIVGFGTSNEYSSNNKLYANNLLGQDIKYDHIYFKLPSNKKITAADFRNNIIGGANRNMLYFNCLVNLSSSENGNKNFEYVRGYAEVADAGLCGSSGESEYGWVKVNTVGPFHPIAKTAWQFSQLYLPQKIYPASDLRTEGSGSNYAIAIIKALVGFVFEANDLFKGVNTRLENDNFSREVNIAKSWIRLNDVTGYKRGGGCRVKSITINDNWLTMGKTNAKESSYGQEFDYTMEDDYNGEKRIISSGVASYEPIIGNDENPFRLPAQYTIDNEGMADHQFYSEEPYGESFFPSAVVGYSKVSVKSITPKGSGGQEINNSRHRTGKVVYQFYTAKDFPTIVKSTQLDPHEIRPSKILTMTKMVDEKHFMGSQGFQVEINDMHGKPKSVFNYSEANVNSNNIAEAQSGIEYAYKQDAINSKELNNEFLVIDRDNTIRTKQVGIESEVAFDARESKSETYAESMGGNVDFYFMGPIPVLILSIIPHNETTINGFKSAVISRVINRYGILKTTTAHQEGATIKTENVLLDGETGAVLLTKTQNEFNDYIYNTTYPAHWVNEYDGMGHGYKNVGTIINITPDASLGFAPLLNGVITEPSDYFVNGDECILDYGGTTPKKCWVFKSSVSGKWMLIDKEGNPLTIAGTVKIKIISSGRKNMQMATVASISSLEDPIINVVPGGVNVQRVDKLSESATGVLNASAVQYSDIWLSNYDDFEEAVSQCEDIYVTYDQHKTTMGQEFRDYLVPLIFNQNGPEGFPRTVPTGNPILQPMNIAISDINISLPSNSKIKALIQSYFNCRGIYPDVSCNVTQSTTVQNCQTNGTPQNITVNRFITINLRVGQFSFAINNYKVSWNATMPTNISADLKCVSKIIWHCNASTTLNPSISAGSGLGQITIASGSLPEVRVHGVLPILILNYPSVGSNTHTFTSSGNPNVTYDVNYTFPFSQTSLNTDIYVRHEDFSSNRYACSDNTLKMSNAYAQYNGSIDNTISALLAATSISDIQKKLYFVYDVNGDYPYTFTTKPPPTPPSIDVDRDPNAKPPCSFAFTSIKVNPFRAGLKGTWRESKNWVYVAKRTSSRSMVTDIRKDGTYVEFNPFWVFNTSGVEWDPTAEEWVMQNQITKYSKFGGAIESKDALQRYSAQLLNLAGLPIGVANNAKYNQLAFDDMESYDFIRGATAPTCPYGHFNFGDNTSAKFMLSTDAHSGNQSMKIPKEQEVVEYRPLYSLGGQAVDDANGYMLRKDDLKGQFNPENGTYILSAWVKIPNKNKVATYDEHNNVSISNPFSIQVNMANASGALVGDLVSLYPSGPIIEGWQKIEGAFTVSNAGSATQIKVKLIASKVAENAFTLFDDLRIQPSSASMKTYVYHPRSLRLMVEMDENNYATFYEYDAEGKLVRTKRETNKGVVTVKENKSAQLK